jgi:hypothetical protein
MRTALMTLAVAALAASGHAEPFEPCPPLPPPSGSVTAVSTAAGLRNAVENAAPWSTVLAAAGTYDLSASLDVSAQGLRIQGATGDRDDVVLDFGGMSGWVDGIKIYADDVTVADLTIRDTGECGVSVQGADRPLLYNLHVVDTRNQLVKVNPVGDGSDDGVLACSLVEYTTAAPDEYTNGISAHDAHGWTVRDTEWRRIRTPGGTPAPTILFWSGSSDTVVERNRLVDCYQGIAFGNASHGAGDHFGGIVRNNTIVATLSHDVVIEMVHATGWVVAHNSAWLTNPVPGLTWGMEARFADSSGVFAGNLTNLAIVPDRDGASATMVDNRTDAEAEWFVNAAAGDLHLRPTAVAAIDQAAAIPEVVDDLDGEVRPAGPAADIGADEMGLLFADGFESGDLSGWSSHAIKGPSR